MFANDSFLDAAREFVCVRIETYESEDAEALVRSVLGGAYANTAFCIFAPDGETRLSRSGRSPGQVLGRSRGRRGTDAESDETQHIVAAMRGIAERFDPKAPDEPMLLQDFHSFRQALNVASGDQRLLLVIADPGGSADAMALRVAMSHEDVRGRFHTDRLSVGDDPWHAAIDGTDGGPGLFVVRADPFGTTGSVVAQLEIDADAAALRRALLDANKSFGDSEARKVYRDHVREGRRARAFFENGIPYGEDRDGDGVVDHGGGRRGRR